MIKHSIFVLMFHIPLVFRVIIFRNFLKKVKSEQLNISKSLKVFFFFNGMKCVK